MTVGDHESKINHFFVSYVNKLKNEIGWHTDLRKVFSRNKQDLSEINIE